MISDVIQIAGALSEVEVIRGEILPVQSLSAEILPASAITGALSGAVTIEGGLSSTEMVEAVIAVPEAINGEYYDGQHIVTPKAETATTLETAGKTMRDDVTVLKIPYFETSNQNGYTVYIGSEV